MSAIQTELFSPTAEDFGIPCIDVPRSDWAIDCAPPVQDRSLAEWREISIARAKDTRPKKLADISARIDRDRCGDVQKLGTVEELGTVSEELGTVSEELGTVSEELGTIPQQSLTDTDPELLINKSEEFWQSVPDLSSDIFELGTIPQQSLTDSQELGTISQQSLTPTVPNRNLKHPLPGMYREFIKSDWYWKFKPYVNGKRKTYHLHKDYDRAVAIGKKILDRLGEKK